MADIIVRQKVAALLREYAVANIRMLPAKMLCLLCLLGVARGESDSASGKPDVIRAAVSEELKREFRYQPTPTIAPTESDGDVVMLPRFDVVDSHIKGVDQAVSRARKKVEDEKFSWKNGGTIMKLGPMKVMFKYDPERGVLDLLKFSW